MGPVSARLLQDVRKNHSEQTREERPERFWKKRAPTGKSVKNLKQVRALPTLVKERVYPKQDVQEGDVERYSDLKFKIDETIFTAHDKTEMRKTKLLLFPSSGFVNNSKCLFWPDVIILARTDLDWMQSISMAIWVQRQTEMNPITIFFASVNNHLHSRGRMGRLRELTTAEAAVWLAIEDFQESMGQIIIGLKKG